MNKQLVLAISVFLVVVGVIAFFILWNKEEDPVANTAATVGSFSYDDYKDENLIQFPSDKILGAVPDAETAREQAESVWVEVYGEQVKFDKPYQVFYDEKNCVWLVQGTLRSNMHGGVANILIDNDTGKVLAVWHGK